MFPLCLNLPTYDMWHIINMILSFVLCHSFVHALWICNHLCLYSGNIWSECEIYRRNIAIVHFCNWICLVIFDKLLVANLETLCPLSSMHWSIIFPNDLFCSWISAIFISIWKNWRNDFIAGKTYQNGQHQRERNWSILARRMSSK